MRGWIEGAVRAGTLPGIEVCIWSHHTVSERHCILVELGLEGLQGCILLQQLCKVSAGRADSSYARQMEYQGRTGSVHDFDFHCPAAKLCTV